MFKLFMLGILAVSSVSMAGSDMGNGGAGIHQGSRYMTFYSAGFYTEPNPVQDEVDVPGIGEFISFMKTGSFLDERVRMELIRTVLPSSGHEYYRVTPNYFDDKTRSRLVSEFSRITGLPEPDIELFAVTDTRAKRTYLLPKFFSLSKSDQVAILFHETYWLLHPDSDYPTVVAVEKAFQASFEQPTNLARAYELVKYLGKKGDALALAIQIDLQNSAFQGLVTPKGIPLPDLLGNDYIACWNAHHDQSCNSLLSAHLYELTQTYPRSLLLKRFYKKVSETRDNRFQHDYCAMLTEPNYLKCIGSLPSLDNQGGGFPNAVTFYALKSFGRKKYQSITERVNLSKAFVSLEVTKDFGDHTTYLRTHLGTEEGRTIDFWFSWMMENDR